jgi:hypothetical protein
MRDVWLGANLDIATPKSLKPGKYLLRHEMINLEAGPAQFFPNCIQLDITGDGNSIPGESELVAFPGAYDQVSPPFQWFKSTCHVADMVLSLQDEETSFVTLRGAEWFYTEHPDDTVSMVHNPRDV